MNKFRFVEKLPESVRAGLTLMWNKSPELLELPRTWDDLQPGVLEVSLALACPWRSGLPGRPTTRLQQDSACHCGGPKAQLEVMVWILRLRGPGVSPVLSYCAGWVLRVLTKFAHCLFFSMPCFLGAMEWWFGNTPLSSLFCTAPMCHKLYLVFLALI